jgi:hypothetical protein
MGVLITMALGLLKFLGGATFGKLIDGVTDVIKNKTDAVTIDHQTGATLGFQYLQASAEVEKAKIEHQTERQVIAGLLLFAVPTGVIWWLALIDGVPWNLDFWLFAFQHRKGSWGIAVPPEFVQDFHTIVQSFFIAAPSLAGVAMLARVFKR